VQDVAEVAGSAKGDNHGQMNAANFEKWAVEKLIPNLPAQPVIVLDNAPYHCLRMTNRHQLASRGRHDFLAPQERCEL
jgi:hypothetical protein